MIYIMNMSSSRGTRRVDRKHDKDAEDAEAATDYPKVPVGEATCMYSAQGDMVCGLQGRGSNYGDAFYSYQEQSVQWADPFQVSKMNTDDVNEVRPEKRPCCRSKCGKTGPCKDPFNVHTQPRSTCSLCQTGMCKSGC
jgi:hypothetical protein